MRYRKLDANGDMVFGHQQQDFWRDVPDAPAQAIQTRLAMMLGEWYLDITDGTPWFTKVLGKYAESTRNLTLQQRVLQTTGVLNISSYSAALDRDSRRLSVNMTVNTIYGQISVAQTLPT